MFLIYSRAEPKSVEYCLNHCIIHCISTMCHDYLLHLSYLALSLRNLLLLCVKKPTDSQICVLRSMIFGVVSVMPWFVTTDSLICVLRPMNFWVVSVMPSFGTTDSLICVLRSMIFGIVSGLPSFALFGGQINSKGTLYNKTNVLTCRDYCGCTTLHGVSHWSSDKL